MSVDKDTNVLDYFKKALVTMPFSEKKLLTTEKVTASDEVPKRTENITTNEEVVKVNDEVQNSFKRNKTIEEVDKVTEQLENMKEAVFTILRKDSDNFEG